MEYTTFEAQAHNGIVTFPETLQAYGNAKVLVTILNETQEDLHHEAIMPESPVRTAGEHLAYLQQVTFSTWTDEDVAVFEETRQYLNQWMERTW